VGKKKSEKVDHLHKKDFILDFRSQKDKIEMLNVALRCTIEKGHETKEIRKEL
jgi:hypothetical protein